MPRDARRRSIARRRTPSTGPVAKRSSSGQYPHCGATSVTTRTTNSRPAVVPDAAYRARCLPVGGPCAPDEHRHDRQQRAADEQHEHVEAQRERVGGEGPHHLRGEGQHDDGEQPGRVDPHDRRADPPRPVEHPVVRGPEPRDHDEAQGEAADQREVVGEDAQAGAGGLLDLGHELGERQHEQRERDRDDPVAEGQQPLGAEPVRVDVGVDVSTSGTGSGSVTAGPRRAGSR